MNHIDKVSLYSLCQIAKDNGEKMFMRKVDKKFYFKIPLPFIFHTRNHFTLIMSYKQLWESLDDSTGYILTPNDFGSDVSDDIAKKVLGSKGGMVSKIHRMDDYRGRNNDGTEVTATFHTAKNTVFSMTVDTITRLRIVESMFNPAGETSNRTIEYSRSLNGGSFVLIDGDSNVVRSRNGGFLTHFGDCTEIIGHDLGYLWAQNNNNRIQASNTTTTGHTGACFFNDSGVNSFTESELCYEIRRENVSNGDVIQIRPRRSINALFNTYLFNIFITVIKPTRGLWVKNNDVKMYNGDIKMYA